MKDLPHFSRSKAFSLVEMLSVIAVIGIISAIAIPNIGRINGSARIAAGQRNAQNFVSVYQSARAAGLDFTGANILQTIGNVMEGGTVEGGVFDGSYFGLPGVVTNAEQLSAMAAFLDIQNGELVYVGEGNGADPLEPIDIGGAGWFDPG